MLCELKFGVFNLIIHLSVDITITNSTPPFSGRNGEQLNKAFTVGSIFILILFGHKLIHSTFCSLLNTF